MEAFFSRTTGFFGVVLLFLVFEVSFTAAFLGIAFAFFDTDFFANIFFFAEEAFDEGFFFPEDLPGVTFFLVAVDAEEEIFFRGLAVVFFFETVFVLTGFFIDTL